MSGPHVAGPPPGARIRSWIADQRLEFNTPTERVEWVEKCAALFELADELDSVEEIPDGGPSRPPIPDREQVLAFRPFDGRSK